MRKTMEQAENTCSIFNTLNCWVKVDRHMKERKER